jgi:plastocyanin
MMSKQAWRVTPAIVLAFALFVFTACSKKTEETSSTGPAGGSAATAPVDKSQAGSVSGTVKFTGTRPAPKKIDMSQDPVCVKAGENTVEDIAGTGDGLANVFVYVENAPAGEVPSSKVVIDQKGCRYHPHVLGLVAGQPIEIDNSDPTTHNIHPTPDPASGNREFNQSQGPGAAPISANFSRPETMLPVKCNQHPWMKMYINVSKTPYFAVTKDDGKYEIKDLPPGTYNVVAVHEKGWKKSTSVTVAPKQAASADFSLGAQ